MEETTKMFAAAALQLTRVGAYGMADAAIRQLPDEQAFLDAVVCWIDTFVATVYPEHKFGTPVGIRFRDAETGRVGTADDVGPDEVWAGRLISYRAAADEEGFMAVLLSRPDGPALQRGIQALLNIVATSMGDIEGTRNARREL